MAEPEIVSDQRHDDWEYVDNGDDDDDRDLRKEIYESQRKRSHTPREPLPDGIVYDDDYTESTASSRSNSVSASVESIEQFINSVRSASTNTTANTTSTNTRSSVNDELETYHPRMEVRALSPYRTPEPGHATVILNKPVPLPDPDIKPKSILKRRPSNENGANEITTSNTVVETKEIVKETPAPLIQPQIQAQPQVKSQEQPQVKPQPQQTTPESPQPPRPHPRTPKEKRGFLNLFSKKQATSAENQKKPVELPVEEKVPEKAVEKEKLSKLRQNSVEENKVEQVAVIDHYSDIVKNYRELSGRQLTKSPLPLYMDHQALREAALQAELEERELIAQQQQQQQKPYSKPASRCMSPEIDKINVNDEEDEQFMLEVAKKMNQYTESNEPNECETMPPPPPPQTDLVEISVEHTKSVSYSVRQIKQPQDVKASNEAIFQVNAKSLTESTKLNDDDGNDSGIIDTKKQDTLSKVRSSSRSRQLGQNSISERRSQSKSPVSERKTSLSSTVLRVTRMPVHQHSTGSNHDIDIDLDDDDMSPSRSPSPEPRCQTTPADEQMQTTTESNVRSTLSYATDLAMFIVAFYLYLFRDARLSIPVLILMVYRQVRPAFVDNIQKWTKRKREDSEME